MDKFSENHQQSEETHEQYFADHPTFFRSKKFCPMHAGWSCENQHSEEVLVRAKVAIQRKNQEKKLAREAAKEQYQIRQVMEVNQEELDLDEDFDAHMAAIEAEEEQTAKDWDSWLEGLTPEPTTAKIGIKPGQSFRSCQHHLQPFTFKVGKQEYTLFGSAYSDRKSKAQAEKAGVCAFLDNRWMKEYSPVWVNPELAYRTQNRFATPGDAIETPTMFLDWPDMGVLEIKDLKPVVSYLASVIEMGVEIGCMGGHGRTGTLMALIMVQLGCKPGKAIKTIRKDYCHRAIETQKQEELIKAYAKEV